MSPRTAFPFRVLSDEAVQLNSWMIGDPGHPLELAADVLEYWDYARDLEVAVNVALDWKRIAAELELPADAVRLKLSLIVGTGAGSISRRQYRLHESSVDSSSGEASIVGLIRGAYLSGRLMLMLQISLDEVTQIGSALSPSVRGARLWQSSFDILLEDGGASRFPIEATSFSTAFEGKPFENAPWYLYWRPESYSADFSATVRLYVNTDNDELLTRFRQGDEPTLQAIMADVASQMIESLLLCDDLGEAEEMLEECEHGSVGRQLRNWLDLSFPDQDLASIHRLREQMPGTFRSAVLAAMAFGNPV